MALVLAGPTGPFAIGAGRLLLGDGLHFLHRGLLQGLHEHEAGLQMQDGVQD